MKSLIHGHEAVPNSQRKFGSEQEYYPARVRGFGGHTDALFTRAQIEVAIERAQDNPEDVPPLSWWERACAFLRAWVAR